MEHKDLSLSITYLYLPFDLSLTVSVSVKQSGDTLNHSWRGLPKRNENHFSFFFLYPSPEQKERIFDLLLVPPFLGLGRIHRESSVQFIWMRQIDCPHPSLSFLDDPSYPVVSLQVAILLVQLTMTKSNRLRICRGRFFGYKLYPPSFNRSNYTQSLVHKWWANSIQSKSMVWMRICYLLKYWSTWHVSFEYILMP